MREDKPRRDDLYSYHKYRSRQTREYFSNQRVFDQRAPILALIGLTIKGG